MDKVPWQTIPLFRHLATPTLEALLGSAQRRTYPRGTTLLRRGDTSQGLIIILEGLVAVQVPGTDGQPRVVVHLGPGQVLGEMALVDQGPHSADVIAVQPTKTLCIPAQAFWDFCEHHPQAGLTLLRNLAAELAFKLRHADLSLV